MITTDVMDLDIHAQLRKENERLQGELNEALRALRKLTGCRWDDAIAARAQILANGGKRLPCPNCKGEGKILHSQGKFRVVDEDDWYERCHRCKGDGEIYETSKTNEAA